MDSQKQINLNFDPNNYDEVVDTVYDISKVLAIAERELDDDQDGKLDLEWDDLLAALTAQPIVREIYRDREIFFDGFLKLDKETAVSAVVQAKEKIVQEFGKLRLLTKPFLGFLFITANSFAYSVDTIQLAEAQLEKGKGQLDMWSTFIKTGNAFSEDLGNGGATAGN